jgi:hypothetical protein
MEHSWAAIPLVIGLAISRLLAGTDLLPEAVSESDESAWEFSLSTSTYLAQHSKDYVNPSFSADRDWFHVEARYNYEALKTGSVWLGYNFSFGKELTIEATPMIGGVFGDITGVAPGYTLTVSYKSFELYTQGEYFFDAAIHAGDFFYSWSEFSFKPSDWFRVGLVIDRTKAFGADFDIRRGPLIGFTHKNVDFTTYWLSPGSRDATFVFGITYNF